MELNFAVVWVSVTLEGVGVGMDHGFMGFGFQAEAHGLDGKKCEEEDKDLH